MKQITQSELKKLLHYDPQTGIFKWIGKTYHTMKMRNIAGNVNLSGYVIIKIKGKAHKAHRLAWLYVYGVWPSRIDHINREKSDNRIHNLRIATASENSRNTKLSCRNKSGIKGVMWNRHRQKWYAKIIIKGNVYNLGAFSSFDDAVFARKKAEIVLGYDPSQSQNSSRLNRALWHLANEFAKLKGASIAA